MVNTSKKTIISALMAVLILLFLMSACGTKEPGKITPQGLGNLPNAEQTGTSFPTASVEETKTMKKKFLYLNAPPTGVQSAELEALGVILYLDSWIPPVGAHPYGYLLAEVPPDTLDAVKVKSFIIRVESADTPFQPD